MKRSVPIACGAILLALVGVSGSRTVASQDTQSECLHGPDETADQRDRKVSAFQYIEAINWAQRNEKVTPRDRRWRAEISGLVGPPAGFTSLLLASDEGYLVSVKDRTDPCQWALFSDEAGLIYVGQPAQYERDASGEFIFRN